MPVKKTKTKTTTKTKPKRTGPPKAKPIDPALWQKAFEEDQEKYTFTEGGGANFLKLNPTQTILRILPTFIDDATIAAEEDPKVQAYMVAPFRRAHLFRIESGERVYRVLDYQFLAENPRLMKRALEEGKITAEDVARFEKHGDPLRVAAENYKSAGKDAKNVPRFPRQRVFWNVIKMSKAEGNEIGVLETGPQFLHNIGAMAEDYPDLTDLEGGRNLRIKGNGKPGIARRYQAPVPAAKSTSVVAEVEEGGLKDLEDLILGMYLMPYEDVVKLLFREYGTKMERVGISPDDFGGVSEAEDTIEEETEDTEEEKEEGTEEEEFEDDDGDWEE